MPSRSDSRREFVLSFRGYYAIAAGDKKVWTQKSLEVLPKMATSVWSRWCQRQNGESSHTISLDREKDKRECEILLSLFCWWRLIYWVTISVTSKIPVDTQSSRSYRQNTVYHIYKEKTHLVYFCFEEIKSARRNSRMCVISQFRLVHHNEEKIIMNWSFSIYWLWHDLTVSERYCTLPVHLKK